MSVVVVGSMNVDLVTRVNEAPKCGETVAGLDFHMYPGGKGANQAIAIKRLEGNVILAGALGNDTYGTFYHNVLVDEKMDEKYIKRTNGETGLAFITLEKNGENRIIIIHGANFTYGLNDLSALDNEIKECNICLSQLEMPLNVVEKFANMAKKHGKTFILNPAPAQKLPLKLIKNVSIITPNETELEVITGMEIKTDEQKIEAAKSLISKGIKTVIITLGSRGCMVVNQKTSQIIPTSKIKPVDTTAAGDSFNGALAYCLDKGESIQKACQFANKVGALTCTKKGAISSLPYLKDLQRK